MISPDVFSAIWKLEGQGTYTLIPGAGFGFPALDFFQLGEHRLVINLFNLAGVDSPLPHYLLEFANHHSAFSNFLNIFNEQLYRLAYGIWKRTHPLANQSYYQALAARMLGLQESPRLLAYASGLFLKPSIVGLRKCLQGLLGSIPCVVTEYVSDWLRLEGSMALGKGLHLNNCILGARFFADQYSMVCTIGPLSAQNSINITLLKELVGYFAVKITITVKLLFDDAGLRLGNFFLGRSRLYPVCQSFLMR